MLLTILFPLFSTSYAAGVFADPVTEGRFVFPPELDESSPGPLSHPVHQVGNTIEVKWQSNTPTAIFDLVIKQYGNTAQNKLPNSENLSKNGYSWEVSVDGSDGGAKFDLLASNQFSFELYRQTQAKRIATSGWFNISDSSVNQYGEYIGSKPPLGAPRPKSTTADQSSSSIPSMSSTFLPVTTSNESSFLPSSSSTFSSVSSVPESTNTAVPQTSQSLQPYVKVGIAIGVVVVVSAVIITILVWFFCVRGKRWARRRETKMQQQGNSQPITENTSDDSPGAPYELGGSGFLGWRWLATPAELQESGKALCAEVESEEKRHEMQTTEKFTRCELAA